MFTFLATHALESRNGIWVTVTACAALVGVSLLQRTVFNTITTDIHHVRVRFLMVMIMPMQVPPKKTRAPTVVESKKEDVTGADDAPVAVPQPAPVSVPPPATAATAEPAVQMGGPVEMGGSAQMGAPVQMGGPAQMTGPAMRTRTATAGESTTVT